MNHGKLDMVKQEMARLNINIVGVSELKWTGMGKFNQMTIISTTLGKNHLKEMEQPSESTKESEMQYLDATSKNDRMNPVCFQGEPCNITVIQVYAPTSNAEEAKRFYDNLQDVLELTPPKKCYFHYRGLPTLE